MPAEDKSPEAIIRRAELWGEVFKAKDRGEVVVVRVKREVRGGYVVSLPWEGLDGFLYSPRERFEEGAEVKARISQANYLTKEIKLRVAKDPEKIRKALEELKAHKEKGEPVRVRVRSAVKGGLLAEYKGVKVFIPEKQMPPVDNPKALIGQELPVVLLRVSKKNTVGSHKKALNSSRK